jgi:hypothetical protein
MKRAIYQVAVGPQSKLYKHCIDSVKRYCWHHGYEHIVLTTPKLMIKPDPFTGQRSTDSYMKYGGFLPIFEKENVFEHFGDYDQIAVVDADIFIKPESPCVFKDVKKNVHFAAQFERELPVNERYRRQIRNYSNEQLNNSVCKKYDWDFTHPNGGEFFNSGMIVYNCKKMLKSLGDTTPKQFMNRLDFKDFIDGIGPFRWQTDQIMLNYWMKKDNLKVQHVDWRFNALFSALEKGKISEAYFIHFFMRHKLPNDGENIDELMNEIDTI